MLRLPRPNTHTQTLIMLQGHPKGKQCPLHKNTHVGLKGTERKQNGNPGGRGGPLCWHDTRGHAASLDLKAEKSKQ